MTSCSESSKDIPKPKLIVNTSRTSLQSWCLVNIYILWLETNPLVHHKIEREKLVRYEIVLCFASKNVHFISKNSHNMFAEWP